MHLADYQEDQRTRNFWTYFLDIPVGSIFFLWWADRV